MRCEHHTVIPLYSARSLRPAGERWWKAALAERRPLLVPLISTVPRPATSPWPPFVGTRAGFRKWRDLEASNSRLSGLGAFSEKLFLNGACQMRSSISPCGGHDQLSAGAKRSRMSVHLLFVPLNGSDR